MKVWHRFFYHIWSARICIKSADFRENCRAASVRTFPTHDFTESRVCCVVRLTCSVLLIQKRNSRLFSLTNIQAVVVSLPRLAVSASVAARQVGRFSVWRRWRVLCTTTLRVLCFSNVASIFVGWYFRLICVQPLRCPACSWEVLKYICEWLAGYFVRLHACSLHCELGLCKSWRIPWNISV